MQPEFWLERWRNNQIGFHQDEFNSHLQDYWTQLHLAPGAPVFVPLSGKSRDILWLLSQGHPVVGVELSDIALRDFFAENRLSAERTSQPPFEVWQAEEIRIYRGDFFDLTPAHLHNVAGVYDRASLIALPPDMRARYAAKLSGLLPAGTGMLLVTMEYPAGQMHGPPFPVAEDEVRALYRGRFEIECLCSKDVLAENTGLRERGLTRLVEKVYRLRRN